MKTTMLRKTALAVMMLSVAIAAPCQAQSSEEGPGRGVARISVLSGDVTVRRGDSGDLVAAAINAPLVVEDQLMTAAGSRAEVQFDYANLLRVGSLAEVRLSELENQRYQIQVARGTVTFRVLRDTNAEVELSTPNLSVRPTKRGTYRITVLEDGTSEVTVRSGEVDIFTPRGSQALKSGKTMIARGNASDPEYQIAGAIPNDDWDRWNLQRDNDLERSQSYQYVSHDVYGAEDLDGYGSWVQADNYGWVWAPRVAVGWSPYHYGRWSWVDYYGWSWVSYDPWGWAPYHYGRWFNSPRHGWCWWPGSMSSRHYWSPGLVAFVGWGGYSGTHVGIGFGNVGWVPLAPYETYYPWYGRGMYGGFRNGGHVNNNVHIVNNVNITNVYRNANVRNAITGAPADEFLRGGGRYNRVSEQELRSASVARGALPMTPTRESLRISDREVRGTQVAQTRENSRFISRRPATQVERVPFEEQRRGMERMSRSVSPAETRSAQPATVRNSGTSDGAGGVTRQPETRQSVPRQTEARQPATRQAEPANQGGWRRFGEPAAGTSTATRSAQPSNPTRTDTGRGATGQTESWRRFGEPAPRQSEAVRSAPESRGSTPARVESSAPAQQERSTSSGWQRSEGSSSRPERSAAPRTEQPTTRSTPQYEAPRSQSSPRSTRSSEPIHISPPIVQQRSAPPPARVESRSNSAPARVESPSSGEGRTSSAPARSESGGSSRGAESRGGSRNR